jgi:hypothetical protein
VHAVEIQCWYLHSEKQQANTELAVHIAANQYSSLPEKEHNQSKISFTLG